MLNFPKGFWTDTYLALQYSIDTYGKWNLLQVNSHNITVDIIFYSKCNNLCNSQMFLIRPMTYKF